VGVEREHGARGCDQGVGCGARAKGKLQNRWGRGKNL